MRISIITLIWNIFSMIFRPPGFEDGLETTISLMRIFGFILTFFILVYTWITFCKYGKNENPDEDYVKMWGKVTLVMLCLVFLFYIITFIFFFLTIIKFIENYDYNLDTTWLAISQAVLLLCIFLTIWEIYLVIMIFLEGEQPRTQRPKKTKVIKSTPVYTNTKDDNIVYEQNEGFEDDFMGMNLQGGGYIGDSSKQSDPAPQLGAKQGQAKEDDFFGPRMDQENQYINENDNKNDGAQYYQTDKPNQDMNKGKKNDDQPL